MDPEVKALLKSIDSRLETMTRMLAVLANNNQGHAAPGRAQYYFGVATIPEGEGTVIGPAPMTTGPFPVRRS